MVGNVKTKLEMANEPWEDLDILGLLHRERDTLGLPTKAFMKPIRYAITGMQVRLHFILF